MNVNSISSTNFSGKTPNVKTIKGALKNGEIGILEFSERHCNAYSARPNGDHGVVRKYIRSSNMKNADYMICIQKLQSLAKEGVDFLKEFMEAMSKK